MKGTGQDRSNAGQHVSPEKGHQQPVPQSSVSNLVGSSQMWDTEPEQGLVTEADSDWTGKESLSCAETQP